jgi:hypothetical protein
MRVKTTMALALKQVVGGIGCLRSSWCLITAYTSWITASEHSGRHLTTDRQL